MKSKKRTNFPEWQGFEKTPIGVLLEIVVDQSGKMGVAYERSCDFFKERHLHGNRWQITFARGGCKLKLQTFDPNNSFRLHSKNVAVLPPGVEHDAMSESAIYDTFTVYPTTGLMNEAAKALGLKPSSVRKKALQGKVLKRSVWLDQIVERYFLGRIVENLKSSDLTFLEHEICNEVLRLLYDERRATRASLAPSQEESPFVRAIQMIEANLFDELRLEELAVAAGASISTLLRLFKKNIDLTPYAFIRKRRLEEACELLLNTDKSIGEISVLVGFNNQGAFTAAFHSMFSQRPLDFRRQSTR